MITINVNFLKAALLFASDEETRYYLKGVHLLRRGDHLRITATDGHRLFCAMQTPDESGPDFDVILPRDGLKKALTGVHRNCEVLALELEWDGDRVKRAVLNDLGMAPSTAHSRRSNASCRMRTRSLAAKRRRLIRFTLPTLARPQRS
jgi:hypothetical protein